MNAALMEELLNEDESSTLDFKREQYPFDKATDEQKSELLKDILAFANAWRRADAYVLIGVEDVKGGRSKVVGISTHFDDARLQQFVNSKAQRPVTFSYETFPFEGSQVGVIRIPIQDRPVYLKQDYGKLSKNTVYIRRGSSTAIADPDEISKMGVSMSQERQEPTLELQFADIRTRTELGTSLELTSILVEYEESEIPILHPYLYSVTVNRNYKKEKAKYIADTSILNPVGFLIKNTGSNLAANVRLEISGKMESHIRIRDDYSYPDEPKYDGLLGIRVPRIANQQVRVKRYGNQWTLTSSFGSVQPKAVAWTSYAFYIGATMPCQLEVEALIFADNLPEPVRVPLTFNFLTKSRKLDMDELEREGDRK